jgi:hypothetical protein
MYLGKKEYFVEHDMSCGLYDGVVQEEGGVVQEESGVVQEESGVVQEEGVLGNAGGLQQVVSPQIMYTMIQKLKAITCTNINKFKHFVDQVHQFPDEIKTRIGGDLDRMINEASPKTPDGDYIEYVSFDSNFFNKNKDPQLANSDPDMLKKVQKDYKACDAVFRDLMYSNPAKYKELFYTTSKK